MNLENLNPDQVEAMHQDYLRDLVYDTGFGSPKLWNSGKPRNFREYLRWRKEKEENGN